MQERTGEVCYWVDQRESLVLLEPTLSAVAPWLLERHGYVLPSGERNTQMNGWVHAQLGKREPLCSPEIVFAWAWDRIGAFFFNFFL